MKIEILGDGCSRCLSLQGRVYKALEDLGMDAQVDSVMDLKRLGRYSSLTLPGLVINGKVHPTGTPASMKQIKDLLRQANA